MRKLLFAGLVIIAVTSILWAAPLRNVPVTLVQPNGDTLHCFASGDEYFNYLHDAGGYVIIRDETTGFYVYTKAAGDDIVPSAFIAGRDNPQRAGLLPYTLPSAGKVNAIIAARREAMEMPFREEEASLQLRNAANAGRNHGTLNNIVIFIRFADDPEFTSTNVNKIVGYCDGDGMSMKTYFREASYGLFETASYYYPESSGGVFSYRDSQNRAYYKSGPSPGYNGSDTERQKREWTLLKNAIEAVKSQISPELNLDMDNNGDVDNITFVIKGGVDAWSTLLWPHKWQIGSGYRTTINGKRTYTYNLQLENELLSSNDPSTLCHELFHTIGAPDLYHYNEQTFHPVDDWDLMASTTNPPQHTSAYMKHKYGNWIADIPVVESGRYALAPLNSATADKVCFKIPSGVSTTEYYVVEYRKKTATGIESKIYGSGLVIYRINTKFKGNAQYNGTSVLDEVYVYRPGGTTAADGNVTRAFFSQESGRTAFNLSTNPKCFLSDGTLDNISISNISAAGDSIYFVVGTLSVDSVSITTLGTIQQGVYVPLSAKLYPEGIDGEIKWTVNDAAMANIVADQLIGLHPGTFTLRAELQSNAAIFSEKTITVNATSITIDPIGPIQQGIPASLSATLHPIGIESSIRWIVNDYAMANIMSGQVIGLLPGTFTLRAELQSNAAIFNEKTITVNETFITIDNSVVQEGATESLTLTSTPPVTAPALTWNVKNVTGKAQIQNGKITGQEPGFVNVRVQFSDCPAVYADKKIVVTGNAEESPVISYWAGRGADGVLTIEAPEGISKIEVFNSAGAKVEERQCAGSVSVQYLFTGQPQGMYFIRVWNVSTTKVSNLKVIW